MPKYERPLPGDTEFQEYTIAKVRAEGRDILSTDGWGVFISDPEDGYTPPEVGDIARVYGRGIGYAHRGIVFRRPGGRKLRVGYYLTPEQGAARDDAEHKRLCAEIEERRSAPIPPTGHPRYEWTPDMGEISGFGGGYEGACRKMAAAGLAWLDEHPDADPKFHGFRGVYGVISEDNDDAKALTAAITAAVDNDCTGAMHQATVSACMYVRANGWDAYCAEMRKPVEREAV